MNSRDRDKADTRQRIVDAALQLFTEQGYERTAMGQIAKAAGTSRANLYLHFSSKPLIVKERMAQIEPEVMGLFGRLDELEELSLENLTQWLKLNRDMYRNHPAEFEAISLAMSVDTEVLDEWIELHERIVAGQQWLTRLFPDAEDRLDRGVHMATLMMSTERNLGVLYLRKRPYLDEDRVLRSLARQWFHLFHD